MCVNKHKFSINKSNKISITNINYQMKIAYYQARFSLAYPIPSLQEWLDSTIVVNAIATNVNVKHTLDQTEKIPQLQKVLMTYKQLKTADIYINLNLLFRVTFRSSHRKVFCEKGVLRIFAKFT